MWLTGAVRRHIHFLVILLIRTPLVLVHFLQHLHFFVLFLNVFRSCLCYFCKIRHGDKHEIISRSTSTTGPETSTCEVPSYVLQKLWADFVYDKNEKYV